MDKPTRKTIVDHIYNVLECKEIQTRDVIEKVLSDISLFDKKQHDYGPENIAKFGTNGILVRSSDKIERLINLYKKELQTQPVNESIEDSWQDLSVYGTIARIFMDGIWMTSIEKLEKLSSK